MLIVSMSGWMSRMSQTTSKYQYLQRLWVGRQAEARGILKERSYFSINTYFKERKTPTF